MKKLFIPGLIISLILGGEAAAVDARTSPEVNTSWGFSGRDANESAGNFLIAGCTGRDCTHGTWGDEWALVAIVANKITEHGGYFCPYQLQCRNKRKKNYAYTVYFHPNLDGDWGARCAWLCEDGYSGPYCLAGTPFHCDDTTYTTDNNGLYNGISLKTSGGDNDMVEWEMTAFDEWDIDGEKNIVLGVTKFLGHGVIAAPIRWDCKRDKSTSRNSWVGSYAKTNGSAAKILCASGYKPNADKSDCVPISADFCDLQKFTMCTNFDRAAYDSNVHKLEPDGGCMKFFCKDTTKAFAKAGDYTCTDCAPNIKGGADRTNGVCVKCQTGQYFSKKHNECRTAKAYTKTDLQYGKDKTKNNTDIKNQCWITAGTDEYKKCMASTASTAASQQTAK